MPIFPMLFAFLTTCAWLVPNHYLPWLSAWGDGLAILGLLLLALSLLVYSRTIPRFSWRLTVIAVLGCCVVSGQFFFGKLLFAGDVLMVFLYLSTWTLALWCGSLMFDSIKTDGALDGLMLAWVFAAMLSVGIALVQWTGAIDLFVYAAEMPPGGRPFGNVAQPNNFCTLCFLGLCGLLWLYQREKLGNLVFFLGASFLLLGMVASQSRAGVLQVVFWLAFVLYFRNSLKLRLSKGLLLSCGAVFLTSTVLWVTLCEFLLLPSGRVLSEQMQAGVRLPYWWSMIDAIGREPLSGYGWLQAGAAQQRVALDHPALGALFDYSHNLFLDLLLWSGLPIGGLIVFLLAGWFFIQLRHCRNPEAIWLLLAVIGVFIHGMLEYPLAYAYFIVPVGLAMGGVEAASSSNQGVLHVPRRVVLVFALFLGGIFSAVASEYLKAEENYRGLRFELARIGSERVELPAVEGSLLPQLYAFMGAYRLEIKPNMPSDALEHLRRVSLRYGYPAMLFRYSIAAGLNGQPEVARNTLASICRIHSRERCSEARSTWGEFQERYPSLLSIAAPDMP